MPTYPMDALEAFNYLTDNVPEWITQATNLAAHTTAKHAEYTEAYKEYVTSAKPRRRKNSSVCSIRTADLFPQQKGSALTRGTATPDPTACIQIQNQDQDAKNEETDGAVPSTVLSTADTLVNSRHNIIIHYDGHTQQSLEDMVRNIRTARNNIRRGRVAKIPPIGFRSGMLPMSGRCGGPPDLMLSNIRSARNCGPTGPRQGVTAFDLADKHLEVAHGLCESAAYLFLRSGDCKADLASVEKKFRILLGLAGAEVQRLNKTREQIPSVFEPKMEEEEEEKSKPQLPSAVIKPTNKPQASANGSATRPIEVDDNMITLDCYV